MRTITINKNDSGQRLDKFLLKRFKTMPKSLMHKYLRTKYIKLNGKKTTPEVFVNEGDVLTLYIKDEFFEETKKEYEFMKASKKLLLVYEDNNLLLIDKKPGVIVHQDKNYDTDCIVNRVQRYLFEKKEYDPEADKAFSPALVNRIDRNTGGIIIGAKNAMALRVLNEKVRTREIRKFYLCVVKGKLKKQKDTLKDYLTKNEKSNTVKVSKNETKNSKEIITKYNVISYDKERDLSLCEVELLTGRTHQIRAHMAYIGHPLLGDEKYGDKALNRRFHQSSQLLCSYKLIFDFKTGADELEYLNGKVFTLDDVWFVMNKKIKL
ncbi:MAG: RluA family pseudouridine synthase [Ruminococcaceae bacterium]|nr:RluA family pseudouridine synthase [Oscillospiraceae bacterium]